MTKDDIIIVCAGSNDISKNSMKEEISNIINFVKKTSHTNIMVTEVFQRHDLADWSRVNNEIKRFNRRLAKRLKFYKHTEICRVNLDRQHFTKHGLHMNYIGKEKMCQQIAESIQ
jgi:lysophospholipase L1-like esterase